MTPSRTFADSRKMQFKNPDAKCARRGNFSRRALLYLIDDFRGVSRNDGICGDVVRDGVFPDDHAITRILRY